MSSTANLHGEEPSMDICFTEELEAILLANSYDPEIVDIVWAADHPPRRLSSRTDLPLPTALKISIESLKHRESNTPSLFEDQSVGADKYRLTVEPEYKDTVDLQLDRSPQSEDAFQKIWAESIIEDHEDFPSDGLDPAAVPVSDFIANAFEEIWAESAVEDLDFEDFSSEDLNLVADSGSDFVTEPSEAGLESSDEVWEIDIDNVKFIPDAAADKELLDAALEAESRIAKLFHDENPRLLHRRRPAARRPTKMKKFLKMLCQSLVDEGFAHENPFLVTGLA